METNIFEYASRRKLRYSMSKGVIMTEDLWDLSLEALNNLAKSLSKKVKELDEEDFIKTVNRKSKTDRDLEVEFEIVKHVIKVKLEENEKRKARAEKIERINRLKEKLYQAEDKELDSKSTDELKKMIEEMETDMDNI